MKIPQNNMEYTIEIKWKINGKKYLDRKINAETRDHAASEAFRIVDNAINEYESNVYKK